MVRARPKTRRARLIRSRRCGKCGGVLNTLAKRCKKCSAIANFVVPGKLTPKTAFRRTKKALVRP